MYTNHHATSHIKIDELVLKHHTDHELWPKGGENRVLGKRGMTSSNLCLLTQRTLTPYENIQICHSPYSLLAIAFIHFVLESLLLSRVLCYILGTRKQCIPPTAMELMI